MSNFRMSVLSRLLFFPMVNLLLLIDLVGSFQWLLLFGPEIHLTLHSLRSGAVQACVDARPSVDALKHAGPWTNNAYLAYLKEDVIKAAPSALGTLLG